MPTSGKLLDGAARGRSRAPAVETTPVADPGPARLSREARVLRDRPFALRLQKACDDNPRVPAYNHGRQAWVRAQLVERFKMNVSNETVSKWFTGVARPRPDKISTLSRLLEVDEAWLALGVVADLEPRERKIRNATADGAVNVLAGFIQMCGGHPAFPEASDPRSRGEAPIDLYAVIKGAHYSFHVTVGQPAEGGAIRFNVPYGHEERVVIGIVQRQPLVCEFLELRSDLVDEHGVRRSGSVEVTLAATPDGYATGDTLWPRIETFAERL